MKSLIAGLLAAVTMSAVSAQAAAPITYTGSQVVGSGSASYSFTTDGTIGSIFASNITGFSVTLTDANGTETLTPGTAALFLTGFDTSFNTVSPLSASSTALTFEPKGNSAYATAQLSVQSNISNADFVFRHTSAGVEIDETVNGTTTNSVTTSAPFVLANAPAAVSAAPEPGSWALMLGGVGIVGAMMRVAQARRREDELKSTATA